MRKELAKFLTEKAEKDPKIFLISLDVGQGVFDDFIKKILKDILILELLNKPQ